MTALKEALNDYEVKVEKATARFPERTVSEYAEGRISRVKQRARLHSAVRIPPLYGRAL